MDSSLYRWINRFADRTGGAHWLFKANAGYGDRLFAVLLLVFYLEGRQHDDITAVAATACVGAIRTHDHRTLGS